MTKKFGLILASLAAVAIVAVGSMTYACGGSCKGGTKTASVKTAGTGTACAGEKAGSSGCASQGAAMTSSGGCSASKNAQTASGSSCSASKNAQMASGSSCSASKNAQMATGSGCCADKNAKAKMAASGCCQGKNAGASCGSKMASLCAEKGWYGANVYEVKDGHTWAVYKGKKFEVTDNTPYTQVENARYYFADNECSVKCQETLKSMAAQIDQETVSLATAEGNVVEVKDGHKWAQCKISGEKFEVSATSPARVLDGQKVYFCSSECAGLPKLTTADHHSNQVN